MATLDERFRSGYPILSRLGRADADGVPVVNPMLSTIAPDLWRIIGEACFGVLWNRPGLTIEQRSMATISIIAVLRRDDNLKGHIESGLDLGLSPAQIVEIILQIFFYAGAPIGTTALDIANNVFQERAIVVQPYRVFDPTEDPEELYRRGLAKRQEVLGDVTIAGAAAGNDAGDTADNAADPVDDDWERYLLEYLWGSVWPRPGLDTQSRMICTLAALTITGSETALTNHIRGARRVGLTEEQINELFFHLTFYTGAPIARQSRGLARQVFNEQPKFQD